VHANIAKEMLDTEEKIAASRREWRHSSKFTWSRYPNDGLHFAFQLLIDKLDPWAVLGLHVENYHVTLAGIQSHYRRVVAPHVSERNTLRGRTYGDGVPRLAHVTIAMDMLDTEEKIAACRLLWMFRTVHAWNPYAEPGSSEALVPLATTASKFECIALLVFSMQC